MDGAFAIMTLELHLTSIQLSPMLSVTPSHPEWEVLGLTPSTLTFSTLQHLPTVRHGLTEHARTRCVTSGPILADAKRIPNTWMLCARYHARISMVTPRIAKHLPMMRTAQMSIVTTGPISENVNLTTKSAESTCPHNVPTLVPTSKAS
jgi:hypothetical protein